MKQKILGPKPRIFCFMSPEGREAARGATNFADPEDSEAVRGDKGAALRGGGVS
jgi:hypothetical protein